MKNLLFESILLVSHRDKKAKKVKFDPRVNVIKGENDTGKSSLIKSIYYAFGANPHSLHHRWKDSDITVLLKFKVDDISYSIFRHRNSFSLFNNNNDLIGTYKSITNELGPKLAELLGFKLKLLDRKGNSITPPPAYLFLPFYIDQDGGWVQTWNSFTSLGQLPRWKKPVINYHIGIRPAKWYILEARKKTHENEKDEPTRQKSALDKLINKTLSELSKVDFDVDVEKFKQEIKILIKECDLLKINQNKYRQDLVEARTDKIRLEAQIEIVIQTHDELSLDYKYAVEKIEDTIGCPTCGAEHTNSFAERFDIAQDTETCNDLLRSLRDDLGIVNHNISGIDDSLTNSSERQTVIDDLLASKHGKVKLKDLVKMEGKKSLLKYLRKESKELDQNLEDLSLKISEIEQDMEKFDDKKRRKNIIEKYGETLRRNTIKLDVGSLAEKNFKQLDAKIDESGSDMPRAILAYSFAIFDLLQNNDNSTFCPLVIDAPNQQEQDKNNLTKILKFISKNTPQKSQLILGLVNDEGIDFGGNLIELKHKYSLLQQSEYEHVSREIKQFEAKNIGLD